MLTCKLGHTRLVILLNCLNSAKWTYYLQHTPELVNNAQTRIYDSFNIHLDGISPNNLFIYYPSLACLQLPVLFLKHVRVSITYQTVNFKLVTFSRNAVPLPILHHFIMFHIQCLLADQPIFSGGKWSLPRWIVWRYQLVCHPRQESDDYAQRYPTCQTNPWRTSLTVIIYHFMFENGGTELFNVFTKCLLTNDIVMPI